MGLCLILLLLLFTQGYVLHAEMCQNRPINLTISLPSNPMPPLLPLPSPCLRGCMTLKCGPSDVTIAYLKKEELCYVEAMLSNNTYCCRKERMGQGNQMQNRGNITCQLAGPDMQHGDKKNRDKENSDMSGGGDHKLIAGIVGSLIVLLLVAIFVVLLVQILRKRRHGHTPPGEGSGYRNRGTTDTYTHREPSPYECPVREPKNRDYAELEREQPTGSGSRYARAESGPPL
ncbi:hypothetical protein GBAR_LOCUS29005 [Geodia barretti]|uniref:Uncharacterized protein n=1 Tax=Geodia barretti TaxID=519541 RepID=A0AA35TSH0_GEOBA|nr:hypothetical protein GBAR_LOCUS29005 [Geodia barretti]